MTKSKSKSRRLQRSGWAIGSPTDFLRLTDEEASFVELKLALAAGAGVAGEAGVDANGFGCQIGVKPIAGSENGGRGPLGFARSLGAVAVKHRRRPERGREVDSPRGNDSGRLT